MRALACAFVLLGLPAAAEAAPAHRLDGFAADLVHGNKPRLIMPGEFAYSSASQPHDAPIYGLGRSQNDVSAPTGVSFGPIHAESEIINGHRRMHYTVDGFTLMGGKIGGSISHGGGMLTLHWGN